MKERWNLWLDLDPIFPWDWNKENRVIKTDSNINGANYLTQVMSWGNEAQGPVIKGESPRDVGPSGFLDKFNDRVVELSDSGYVCEGIDTERCPWPAGVFSSANQLCRSGYFFSYLTRKCQQMYPLRLA